MQIEEVSLCEIFEIKKISCNFTNALFLRYNHLRTAFIMKMERLLLILKLYMRSARFFRSQSLSWLLTFRKQPVSLSVRPEEVGKVLSFRRNDYISTSMTDDISARKMASLIFMRRKVNPESTKRLWRFALSPLTEAAARFSTPDEFFIVICWSAFLS